MNLHQPQLSQPGTLRVLIAGLLATAGALAGCDCDSDDIPPTGVAALAFNDPEDGATLNADDDLRNTLEGIQPAISLEVRNFSSGTLQLTARADNSSLNPDVTAEVDVNGAGTYTFNTAGGPTFTIPVGDAVELRAELINDAGELVISSSVTVKVEGEDVPLEPSVQITRPTDGTILRADADLDPDTEGYQLDVAVRLEDVTEGATLRLSFNDDNVEEVELDGADTFTFPGITANLLPGASLEIAVEVESNGEVTARDSIQVTLEEAVEPSCALTLEPAAKAAGCDFVEGADEDPDADGVQRTFTLRGDCETAQLAVNGAEAPPVTLSNDRAEVQVTLDEGVNTLLLSGTLGDFTFTEDPVDYEVDTAPPVLTFTSLTPGQTFGAADDANGDLSDGLQIAALLVQTEGLPANTSIILSDGDSQLGTAEIDGTGVATFLNLSFVEPGEHTLTTSAADACGNLGLAAIVINIDLGGPETCAATLATPPLTDTCGSNAASVDADPDTDGFQVSLTIDTSCATVALEVNGTLGDALTPADGAVTTLATLQEGANTLRLTGANGDFTLEGLPVDWTVDTLVPTVDLEGLAEGQALGLAEDVNSDTSDGVQYQSVVIATSGLEEGTTVRLLIDGEESDVTLTDAGDGTRLTVGVISFVTEGAHTVTAEITDACGNTASIARNLSVVFEVPPPTVAITAPAAGVTLNAEDPANATTPGFQTAVTVTCSEVAAPVTLADGVGEILAQGTCGADNLAILPVTLSRGAITLIASSEGASGASGVSAPITISVDFNGCGLVLVDPPTNQLLLLDDNDADPANGVGVDFAAVVTDLAGCAGRTVSLKADGGEVQTATITSTGEASFTAVPFASDATYSVTLDVEDADGELNTAGPITVVVDITPATLTLDDPTGDPVVLGPADDLDGAAPGLTTCIVVSTEGAEGGVLAVASSLLPDPIAAGLDPTGASQQLCDLVLPEGVQLLTVSLMDAVGRVIERSINVEVDLTAPGIPILSGVVDNRRSGQTTLSWTGAGDDGASGRVTSWQIWRVPRRRDGTPSFGFASLLDTIPSTTDAAGVETYTVDSLSWVTPVGSVFSSTSFLAVRGVDNLGQIAPDFATISVDTELLESAILGDTTGGRFGITAVGVGDINNDGFDDVVLGDYTSDQLFLFFGREDISVLNNQTPDDLVPLSFAVGGNFGISVAPLGDVNGDLIDDFAVGAAPFAPGQAGNVYVYLGADGLGFDGTPASRITGPAVPANRLGLFGYYIAGGGNIADLTNEGLNDILIGAPRADGSQSAVVVTGRQSWTDLTVATGVGSAAVNGLNGIAQITSSLPASAGFGWVVGVLDDLNDDGFNEFVVGAPDTLGAGSGQSFVFEGGSILSLAGTSDAGYALVAPSAGAQCGSAMAIGDINDDGLRDVIVSCPTGDDGDRIAFYEMTALVDDKPADRTFRVSLGARYGDYLDLVDVNDDGRLDLVVGSTPPMGNPGTLFVHFNNAGVIDPAAGIIIGNRAGGYGEEVSALGDVNGDGFEDFSVGQISLERVYFVY